MLCERLRQKSNNLTENADNKEYFIFPSPNLIGDACNPFFPASKLMINIWRVCWSWYDFYAAIKKIKKTQVGHFGKNYSPWVKDHIWTGPQYQLGRSVGVVFCLGRILGRWLLLSSHNHMYTYYPALIWNRLLLKFENTEKNTLIEIFQIKIDTTNILLFKSCVLWNTIT